VRDFEANVSAAALVFLPFVGLFLVLAVVLPPSAEALRSSDPLVQLLESCAGPWAIAVVSALPSLGWLAWALPSREALVRAVRGAIAGLVVAGVGLPLLRVLVGPALPAFVPAEESARPGIALGVGAGVLEEAVFRIGLLAVAYLLVQRVWPTRAAVAFAVVVTGFAFALAHELGPGAGPFDPRFFATRFAIPGCAMSALFFRPGPSFLVTLHASSHVGIALLFSGSPPAA
jgi:hypothetical protein